LINIKELKVSDPFIFLKEKTSCFEE